MMYYYWSRKGVRPSVFYNMPQGEKTVIRAFYEHEIKEKDTNGNMCPLLGSF